mmetsp:Transcript_104866/g.335870  ORF Transcript_104866/g.335870 Transcript_104866/m.335870 type:complete len:140 (+) Transcript_104866:37-456(+)
MDYTREAGGTKLSEPQEHWMKELKGGRTVRVRELGSADLGRGEREGDTHQAKGVNTLEDGAQLRTKCTLDVLLLGAKEHHGKRDGSSTAVARASAMEKTDEVVRITATVEQTIEMGGQIIDAGDEREVQADRSTATLRH